MIPVNLDQYEESLLSHFVDFLDLNPLQATRNKNYQNLLLCHINVNGIQNEFEELKDTVIKSNVQIMAVSETKIDGSYPNSQFMIPGYYLHRNDKNY